MTRSSSKELEAEVAELRQQVHRYEAYLKRIRRDVNLALSSAAIKVTIEEPKVEQEVVSSPQLQEAIDSWMEYKGNGLKSVGKQRAVAHIRKVAGQESDEIVIESLNTAMGNGWKGWDFPDKRPSSGSFKTNGQKKFDITKTAVEKRLDELEGEPCPEDDPYRKR